MRDLDTSVGTGCELYNEVQRLICQWRGRDSAEQSAMLPELLATIVRLKGCQCSDNRAWGIPR